MTDTLNISEIDFLENNSEKYKPLAWVEILTDIQPIEGADAIDMAKVSCGNEVIVKRGEFQIGDECIYISTDTQLPEDSRWEFLRSNKFRVKCKKMRGVWSDGLVLPLSVISENEQLKNSVYDCEGKDGAPMLPFGYNYDVTAILGVEKIPEKSISNQGGGAIFGRAKARFPEHTPRTDEENLYGLKPQKLLEAHKGKLFRASVKLHGSSGTFFFKDGYFGVCSRNLEVQEDDKSEFWKVARKIDIQDKLEKLGRNLSIQGEVCGPKLNGNIYNFPELRFFVHNIYDNERRRHLNQDEMIELAKELELEVCPEPFPPFVLDHTMEELVAMVEKPSIFNPEVPEEGLVFRPVKETYCDIIRGRLSFKIVSRLFKAKYKK